MPLQDLTPQLRTRLSRMERAVGWFVILATLLILFGFGYYVYKMSERKGWFTPKFKYQTSLNNAAGLKVGDPVKLMGFNAGQITDIIPEEPTAYYGVTIVFSVLRPHYGYIWDDSTVKVSSDLLGNRFLEITKGRSGVPTIEENTNKVPQAMLRWQPTLDARKRITADLRASSPDLERTNHDAFVWMVKDQLEKLAQTNRAEFYTNLDASYWIAPQESPALNERLEQLANEVEQALPNILNLTNQLAGVLSNSATLTSNLNLLATSAQPAVSNLNVLLSRLDKPGSLGEWILPTNVNQKLDTVLGSADMLVANANTNLATLNESLLHLSDLTSNLNQQVQINSNILSSVSKAVEDADDFVQGLKHHWLLRSAFKKENSTERSRKPVEPLRSPKESGQR